MTAQQIISQIEKTFGRQPEQYMFQLINDALDDAVIDVMRVEIKDTNDRYVMIPKLADSHKILREDTDSNNATWTTSSNTTATSSTGSQGADDSLT